MGITKRTKRTGIALYSVDYYNAAGRRIRKVVGPNKQEAEKYLKHCLEEVQKQVLWGEHIDMRLTFEELWERYLTHYAEERLKPRTIENYKQVMRDIMPFFKRLELGKISADAIHEYIAWKKNHNTLSPGKPVSNATINLHLFVLKGIFRQAVKWGLCRRNPCDRVERLKAYVKEMRPLTHDEYRRLLDTMTNPLMKQIVILAVNTGMRAGEIMGLRFDQVFLKERVAVLKARETKGSKVRRVPLNQAAIDVLEARKTATNSPYVFAEVSGKMPFCYKTAWRRALKESGIEGVRFHDLRHTCGSWMAKAGVPVYDIKEVLGHAHIATTMRYVHVSETAKQQAVSALEKIA